MRTQVLNLVGRIDDDGAWLRVSVLVGPDGDGPAMLLVPADMDQPLTPQGQLLLGQGYVHIQPENLLDVCWAFTEDGRTIQLRRGPMAERTIDYDTGWEARLRLDYRPAWPAVVP